MGTRWCFNQLNHLARADFLNNWIVLHCTDGPHLILLIHLSMVILGYFHLSVIVNSAAMNTGVYVFVLDPVFNSVGHIARKPLRFLLWDPEHLLSLCLSFITYKEDSWQFISQGCWEEINELTQSLWNVPGTRKHSINTSNYYCSYWLWRLSKIPTYSMLPGSMSCYLLFGYNSCW